MVSTIKDECTCVTGHSDCCGVPSTLKLSECVREPPGTLKHSPHSHSNEVKVVVGDKQVSVRTVFFSPGVSLGKYELKIELSGKPYTTDATSTLKGRNRTVPSKVLRIGCGPTLVTGGYAYCTPDESEDDSPLSSSDDATDDCLRIVDESTGGGVCLLSFNFVSVFKFVLVLMFVFMFVFILVFMIVFCFVSDLLEMVVPSVVVM